MARRLLIFSSALLVLAATVGAARVGQVSGTVVDGTSGRAIANAVVTLTGRGIPALRAVVDADGRFAFSDVPAGIVTVNAAKGGFFGGAAGQRSATGIGRPLELGDGSDLTNVTLKLWKFGAITGAVTGDAGDPLIGVEVRALRRSLLGGRWLLTTATSASTDDRGRYRLSGLIPGDYAVVVRPDSDPDTPLLVATLAANPASAQDVMAATMTTTTAGPELDASVHAYPLTFYPAASSSARATLVTIGLGDDRGKIDFHLRPGPTVHVSGVVTGGAGSLDGVTVRLIPADTSAESTPTDVAAAACDEGGRFEFSAVAPGRYRLSVLIPPSAPAQQGFNGQQPQQPLPLPSDPTMWADMAVVVGTRNVTKVSVPLQRGGAVSGRLEFDGSSQRPGPQQLSLLPLRLDPINQTPPTGNAIWRGMVDLSGTFRTMNVPPGKYVLRIGNAGGGGRGWAARSALAGKIDILDAPIEIRSADVNGVIVTASDRPFATMSGHVTDAKDAAAPDATIAIFPVDRTLWLDTSAQSRRLRLIRPAPSGTYTIGGLPAGDYFVIATNDSVGAEWQSPRRLDAWSRIATRVTIADAETHTLDLRIAK